MDSIKDRFIAVAKPVAAEVKAILKEHGDMKLADYTLAQAYGGMRGIVGLVTETSLLDANEGIRFRGYSIAELRELLPKAPGGSEPLPEGIFYLMLTGELPTEADVQVVSNNWARRAIVPRHVFDTLDALPINTHPMTQFSIGIMALQTLSQFAKNYREGMNKADYWESTYEDAMNLIARLPRIAAYIYRRVYHNRAHIEPDPKLDWSANFAHMLGYDTHEFQELMRLYLSIHADHEGGNVSAHTTHLVGSALSDPYLAFASGMNGLAGPLHGLANQEVLRWLLEMQDELKTQNPTAAQVEAFIRQTLSEGKVIPGYGHAVLRKTDPRFTAQMQFAKQYLPDDALCQLVWNVYEIAPKVLGELGKVKNPWPNVDAHSGALLMHFGMKEYDFYTVMFGVSRSLGVMASLCWDRVLGLGIERPKSVTTDWIKQLIKGEVQVPNE
jgi:citrate synthase